MNVIDSRNKFDRRDAAKKAVRDEYRKTDFVQVAGYHPAQIVYSQARHSHFVTLESQELSQAKRGQTPRAESLTFTGAEKEDVRKQLVNRFGNAVTFLESMPARPDPVAKAKADIVAEQRQAEDDLRTEEELKRLKAEHVELCKNSTPEMIQQMWHRTATTMMTSTEVALDFADKSDFFSWPHNGDQPSNENWNILVKALRGRGLPDRVSPTLDEMISAYKFCRDGGYFHQTKVYKRSGYLDQPKPLTDHAMQIHTESVYESAVRKVSDARLSAGTRVTWVRARQIGLTREEFESLLAVRNENNERDFEDLKHEVVSSRPVRSRADLDAEIRSF